MGPGRERMTELSVPRLDHDPAATSLDVLARLAAGRLDGAGVNWRAIAAAHGLKLDGEAVEGARIPTDREFAFLEDSAKASGDPLFAWKLGDMSVRSLGLPGYSVLNAGMVAEALDILATLVPSVCEALHYTSIVDADEATLACVCSEWRQNGVLGLHFMLGVLRELVGPHFAPTRVGLAAGERAHLHLVSQQVAAPVAADRHFTFVTFPARYLSAKVQGADARLAEVLRPYWQRERQAASRRPPVLRSRLEGAIVRSLHEGPPTVARIAEDLRLGRSRIEAELSALGGWRAVIDDVRRRLAMSLVLNSDFTMAAIAAVLGYSEPGAFNHAYRRWTGHSPGADRHQPHRGIDGRARAGGL